MTEIEHMAAIAAEHVNGGKFNDGDFYSPEHRERWIEAMQIATEPLYKKMQETALISLSIDSRAMDLQLLCDKQAMRLAEAVEVMRDCIALLDGDIGGSAQQAGVLAEALDFLAKLEPKP